MGREADRALAARRRAAEGRVERAVAGGPLERASQQRLRLDLRVAGRRLKELRSAELAIDAAQVNLGRALLRLAELGVSQREVSRAVGVPRHLGRRYVALALRSARGTDLSTVAGAALAHGEVEVNGGTCGAAIGGTDGGKT